MEAVDGDSTILTVGDDVEVIVSPLLEGDTQDLTLQI